jgi:hypothetical protein
MTGQPRRFPPYLWTFLALVASSLVFRIPFSTGEGGGLDETMGIRRTFASGGASLPLLAILSGILVEAKE